ncbi:MAG: hypothetical protein EB127_28435, partial [Alphaproteobacteria bacterium]|nr:hypothetical protein [Alphaproteobacteria bacterium]
MQKGLVKIDFYTRSLHKNFAREVINAGSSQVNQKLVKLSKAYRNPSFYPRKFEEWPDKFEVSLLEDNTLSIKRVDNPKIGWGANLLVDVEHEINSSVEVSSPQPSKIPKVIYQTFKSREVPVGMAEAISSWKDINSCYEHYFYDDHDSLEFIKNFYGKDVADAYLSLIPGAFKADLWRCCVLFEKGGVYVDSDMICLRPLDDFLNFDDEFVVPRDDPMSKSFLYNAFIACTPKHKFIEKQIDSIVYNVKNKVNAYYLDVAGPGLLGKSVNFCLSRDPNFEYDLGRQEINGCKLNILLHDFKSRSICSGEDKVVYTEYSSKNKEMDSLKIPTYYSLYKKGIVYQRIPRKIYYTT